ncbi:hypothetical protein [Pontibacter sp. SGAir0037]|uniref:hypothetical protein n=1 Tax=Pontibacter sp. SGAir0037 TaxID=2571030 RepID=UPI0010CCEEF0|nr:hypothetical protein [Pontibacter sp. SGAir0037]QCR24138.1 hypothetical protein C1N53_18425 [Pontibacter sp. SGAir0037]
MIRSFLTILFLGIFSVAATAQHEFASIEMPTTRVQDLVTVADEEGNVCVYYYQGGKIYFNLLSPSGEQLASQIIPFRMNQDPQILGTRVVDDTFIFYSRHVNGRRHYLRPFGIDKRQGTFRSFQDIELKVGRGEQYIGSFADQQHFYMVYTDKHNNIHLYRDAEDAVQMEKKIFASKMPRTNIRQQRENELIYVNQDLERTVFTGHHRSKIYSRGDRVHMVFDGYQTKGNGRKVTTEILTLDWNSGQANYRTLPYIEQKNEPKFNSFLHENTLFRLQLDKDSLKLVAYDFNTLAALKEYSFGSNEEITLKATPVFQRGRQALFSSKVKEIEGGKELRNLADGVPAITVDAFNDSTIQLTIGSYAPPASNRNNNFNDSRMVRTPDQYVRTARGVVMVPGRWTPAYTIPSYYLNSPFYSRYFYDPYRNIDANGSDPGVSTYFRAVLDKNSLAARDTSAAPSIPQYKLEKFEQELKPSPDFATLYRYGNKLHYGYFDRKSRTFKIVEFAQQ